MKTLHFEDKASWLAFRTENKEDFYGASEAATAADLSPWKSSARLYLEKVGLKPIDDISEKERVRYGTDAEKHITALFALDYRNVFEVTTAEYDVLLDDKFPFIGATLDGYLKYTAGEPWVLKSPTEYVGTINPGDLGNYEGKTSFIWTKRELNDWLDHAPEYYLAQLVQQLYVRRHEVKFVFINSLLEVPVRKMVDGEWKQNQFNHQQIVRHVYFMDDPVVRQSMEYVIKRVVLHHKHVKARQMPDFSL